MVCPALKGSFPPVELLVGVGIIAPLIDVVLRPLRTRRHPRAFVTSSFTPSEPTALLLLLLPLLLLLCLSAGCSDQAASANMDGPKSWYTIDDGRTWFADAANKVVPFEHQGKQAYRCFVWSCDGGKTMFVSHLERLSAAGRRAFAGKDRIDPLELVPGSEEVKPALSGDNGWMPSTSPQAQSVRMPQCPDRKGGTPEAVWPK